MGFLMLRELFIMDWVCHHATSHHGILQVFLVEVETMFPYTITTLHTPADLILGTTRAVNIVSN